MNAPLFAEDSMEYRAFFLQRHGFLMREIAARLGISFEEVEMIVLRWLLK